MTRRLEAQACSPPGTTPPALKISPSAVETLTVELFNHVCDMHEQLYTNNMGSDISEYSSDELTKMYESSPSEYPGDGTVKEICVKTHNELWIVGRKAGSRQVYLILDQKLGLVDVHAEVDKLCSSLFNMFFMN